MPGERLEGEKGLTGSAGVPRPDIGLRVPLGGTGILISDLMSVIYYEGMEIQFTNPQGSQESSRELDQESKYALLHFDRKLE